jgi:outer membrane lipoprotein-sorting protein
MKTKRWIAFSLLLILALVLAGCGREMTAEEIVAKMQETVDSTQDAHAVVVAEVNAQGIQLSATAELWEQMPNKVRAEVLEASEASLVGTLLVSDGANGWFYEPARNLVTVGAVEELDTPLPQEILVGLQEVIQHVLNATDVELVGEETVAGREAYKLEANPKEDAEQQFFPGNGTATVWVDKDQWIVLKATYEAGAFGRGSMEVQSFELNPGLSADLFAFEVPEGATVVDVEAQEPVPLMLDEALAQAGFPLLVPAYVPEGTTLIEVYRVDEAFVLRYDHSPDVSFTVFQGPEEVGPPSLGKTQDITVRGYDATAITDEVGGNTFLYWTENGITVTIAGRISLEEAIQVAESLE